MLAGPADAGERVVSPPGAFYYQPAATVQGGEAAWNNPAALGRLQNAGFQLMADYYAGDYAKSWGWNLFRDRAATAYRHVDNPGGEAYDEWLWAAGMKFGPQLNVGFSYRYFRNGPGEYNNRHLWTIALLSRGHGPFALSAVFSNLNKGRINGVRSAIEHRYSIGYRPLGNQLTLAADMLTSSRDWSSDARFIYHAEYIARPGLFLNGYVDNDGRFELGVRVNLLKFFTGTRSSFDRHGHDGRTTLFLGAVDRRQSSLIAEPKHYLALGLTGRPLENPPRPVFGSATHSFLEYLLAIYRAADDPSIAALSLQLGHLSLGMGQAQELRDALTFFRSRGKRIICHLDSPNNLGYYVASVADSILIPPVSELQLVGLRAELTYFAGAFQKLGINLELLRVGDYKDAPEAYTRREPSDASREQMNRLLDDLYDQFVDDIALGRNFNADSVRNLIDRGPFTSREALAYGLVDGLCYRDETTRKYLDGLAAVSFARYQRDSLPADDWPPRPVLAVVVADGEITSGSEGSYLQDNATEISPAVMARALGKAQRDSDIAAVVLRINSPGGWALAGEEIHHSVAKTTDKKPVVVSMANVAASGGYYIAMPGSRLFADPATITGSVGIYGGKLDLSALYRKIDLGKELYTRGRFAGMMTAVRPFTEEERSKYQSHLQAFYEHFVELVAANRRLPPDSIDSLSRGRVWTGREARSIGLVDELGGLKAALDYTAREAGLDDYEVRVLPEKRPWFILPGASLWREVLPLFGLSGNTADDILPELPIDDASSIIARLPYDIDIQ